MVNIGWFSTGRGKGSLGLLSFVQQRLLETQVAARINFVFSNRDRGEAEGSDEFFRLVDSYNLPLVTNSSAEFQRRINGRISPHREEFDLEAVLFTLVSPLRLLFGLISSTMKGDTGFGTI